MHATPLKLLGLLALVPLLHACASVDSVRGEIPPHKRPRSPIEALVLWTEPLNSEFPASVTDGHHGGTFITTLSNGLYDGKSPATLFQRFKDEPYGFTTERRTPGLTRCAIGMIPGAPIKQGGGAWFDVVSAEDIGSRLVYDIKFTTQRYCSTAAPTWAFFKFDVGALPAATRVVEFHFRQYQIEMGFEDTAPKEVPPSWRTLADLSISLPELIRKELNYRQDLTNRRTVREDYASGCSYSWEVAQNWRGIEILDGPLTCCVGDKEEARYGFRRGIRSGGTKELASTSCCEGEDTWVEYAIAIEGEYVSGVQDGVWRATYENGALCYEIKYEKGEGVEGKSWFPEGKMNGEFSTTDGITRCLSYFDNGKLSHELFRRGPKKHGYQRMWWYNGQLREEREYSNGALVKPMKRWDRDGREIPLGPR